MPSLNLPLTCSYPAPDGRITQETFQELPRGVYAAMGCNGTKPGALFVCRLTREGTSLVSVHGPDGKQPTLPVHAGKTFQDGTWINQ